MTNKYTKVIYGKREKSNYPEKLIKHLYENLIEPCNYGTLLDVGCGDGTFTYEWAKLGFKCSGIDSPEINFETDKLPYKDNTFNHIFCKSVIEHVKNVDNFLKELRRVLKPMGTLIILTPSWEHVYKDFYNDYTHVKPFHRKGLSDCLKINGFEDVGVGYFYQLPFLWKLPILQPFVNMIKLLPDSWKWKDFEQTKHNKLIRFSKEVMLLGVATK